jgi:RHS repeat-associated protein
MTRLHHEQGPGGTATWTRHFGYAEHRPVDWAPTPGSRPTTATGGETAPNRLTNVGTSETVGRTHGYDPCGNLRSEGNSTYRWDFTDRLKGYEETASGQTSVTAGYAYNADGTRVKKVVDKGDRREVSVYVDGIFEHHRLETAGSDDTVSENNELHVKAQDGRVAVRRVGTPFDDDRSFADGPRPATEYHLPDHLGNSSIVTDASGGWINREEYTPFGETALGGYERKRYRYGGKERDEESGLYYHGARYYAPWLCRWTTTDPAGHQDGLNRYLYVSNDPIRYSDPNGTQRENNATDGSSSGSSGDTSGGSGGGGQSNGGGSGSGGGGGQSEEGKQRKQNAYIIRLSEDDFLIVSKKEAQGVSQAYGIPGDLSEHLPSDIYAAHVEKTDEGLRIKQRFVYSPGKEGTDGQFVPLQRALTRARFGEMHEEMTGGARSHEARRPRPVVRRKVKGPDGRYRYKALSPKELKKYRRKKLRTLANSYWACIAYAVEDRWLGGSSDNKTNESMELLTMKVYESAQGVFESGVEGKHMQQTQRYATPGNTGGVENAQRKFKEFTRKNREKGSDILTQRGGRKAGDSTSNEPFNASTVKSRDRQDPDNPEEALDMVIDELKQMENN